VLAWAIGGVACLWSGDERLGASVTSFWGRARIVDGSAARCCSFTLPPDGAGDPSEAYMRVLEPKSKERGPRGFSPGSARGGFVMMLYRAFHDVSLISGG